MLEPCKNCKCSAVCSIRPQLEELNKRQNCDMSKELADVIKYKITYECRHYVRKRENAAKKAQCVTGGAK